MTRGVRPSPCTRGGRPRWTSNSPPAAVRATFGVDVMPFHQGAPLPQAGDHRAQSRRVNLPVPHRTTVKAEPRLRLRPDPAQLPLLGPSCDPRCSRRGQSGGARRIQSDRPVLVRETLATCATPSATGEWGGTPRSLEIQIVHTNWHSTPWRLSVAANSESLGLLNHGMDQCTPSSDRLNLLTNA